MARLILVLLFVAAIALALVSVMIALRIASPQSDGPTGGSMPKPFTTIAYVLLILLMFGVTSGLLGAA